MTKRFIDISEHNTILSLKAIGQSNLSGCIIKATEGVTYKDSACDILYDGINDQLPIGFYHYLTVTSEPEMQAQEFYNRIKDKQYQILPVLDVEQDSLKYKAQSYAERFMSEFYRLCGQKMIMYSYTSYISDNFDVSFRNDNIWWVADYGRNNPPTLLGCKIIAWQYTESSHEYAFNNGDLDVSILYDEDYFFIDNVSITQSDLKDINEPNFVIANLQSELNKQGFKDKNGNSLVVDGVAGELTLSACPIIKTGANGMLTQWVQLKVGTTADGYFGEETRQAVIVFQENMSLDGDGIVGKNTWRKLLGM